MTIRDYDGNGTIDPADAAALVELLLHPTGTAPACPLDMDSNGQLDGRDIQLLIAQY